MIDFSVKSLQNGEGCFTLSPALECPIGAKNLNETAYTRPTINFKKL